MDAVEKSTEFALPGCEAHIDNTIQIAQLAISTNHEVALTHDRRAQMAKDRPIAATLLVAFESSQSSHVAISWHLFLAKAGPSIYLFKSFLDLLPTPSVIAHFLSPAIIIDPRSSRVYTEVDGRAAT